ncbi:hypothetical protein [Paenibacillus oleatilyticus]|uniref:hypothetical protein n=1 Tax=Paenibacillus oleatilyticus TaxID=2594886 RepID=UPI001C1F3F81|nr:hypothetical protein [Paenibacillus oleatilyticus]MBU7314046.1 hypothetical protein [Paenibacillus oleatilyticus]
MNLFSNQRRSVDDALPQSPIVFATVAAVDQNTRSLKLVIEPWGTETGWCRVLRVTDPVWPYKVDQEVLAAAIRGDQGDEQYVVLGLLDGDE